MPPIQTSLDPVRFESVSLQSSRLSLLGESGCISDQTCLDDGVSGLIPAAEKINRCLKLTQLRCYNDGVAGRPTSLTAAIQKLICKAIENGNYRSTAAAMAGIHRKTLADWERRGELGDSPFDAFSAALQTSEAKFEDRMLQKLLNAEPGIPAVRGADLWQSTAWVLERRFASRWCARVKQQTAEHVDALAQKLKAKPELQAAVIAELAGDDESPAAGANGAH